MDPRLRKYPRSLLSQDIPPDTTYRGQFDNRVESDAQSQWGWGNTGSKEHWPPQSFSPQAQAEFDAITNAPLPPETLMGNQIGLQDIIKMMEIQRMLRGEAAGS